MKNAKKKQNVLITSIMLSLPLLILQGCNSSSDTTESNAVKSLSSQTEDSDPSAITTSLQDDITTLFKTADDEPIAIENGDSLTDVFNRAGG